jgi:hypothetical protein
MIDNPHADVAEIGVRLLDAVWQLVEPCPDSLVRDKQHLVE